MKEKYSTQIARFDSKNAFLEVLNSAFSIGKVQINFCAYDEVTKTQTKKLPIYVDVPKMLALCNNILNGRFQRMVMEAKKTGTFNGMSVNDYTSFYVDMGGIHEEGVRRKFDEYKKAYPWVQEGKGISRQFKIQAGRSAAWILRAEYGLGVSNEKRLIVPSGKAPDYINIPMTEDSLQELAIVFLTHYNAYLSQYYNKFGDKLFAGDKCNVFVPTSK